MDKSILDVVHDSAKGLYDAGIVDSTTMHEFDSLCLPEVETFTPVEIKKFALKSTSAKQSLQNT
jgi:putative transcriptional regulator